MAADISIIIPVLNEAKEMSRCLVAFQPMRARGAEVIVVDGGSTDSTAATARSLSDHVLVAPRGRASQMNAGAAMARGRVLWFVHADTRVQSDADVVLLAAIGEASAGKTEMTWGRFDVQIDSRRISLSIVSKMMNLRSRLSGIATGDQAIFVGRSLFQQVGAFPDQPLMEDIALSSQLKRIAPPLCLRETVLTSARRWEEHGVVATILLMWRLRAAYFLGTDPWRLARQYGYQPRER